MGGGLTAKEKLGAKGEEAKPPQRALAVKETRAKPRRVPASLRGSEQQRSPLASPRGNPAVPELE